MTNQKKIGSYTPETEKIRTSHRLADIPKWVRDYVINLKGHLIAIGMKFDEG
ncbi:MAG: hypothetical protein ACXQS7_00880 [Candidatus Syntropharchaeia archaeon]